MGTLIFIQYIIIIIEVYGNMKEVKSTELNTDVILNMLNGILAYWHPNGNIY